MIFMAEAQTSRQTAALCVARIFEGHGDKILAGAGKGFGAQDEPTITDREKSLLEDLFEFFLRLIEGGREKEIYDEARLTPPTRKITEDVSWDRRLISGEKEDLADD